MKFSLPTRPVLWPLLLLGLGLGACTTDSGSGTEPSSEASSGEDEEPAGQESPARNFELVPGTGTVLTWKARASGKEHQGRLTRIFGGLYPVNGDLDGAMGTISGNLRYIETGERLWDQTISESFFETLDPKKENVHGQVLAVRLPPSESPGEARRGEVSLDLGFARGAQKLMIPIEVSRSDTSWRVRSLEVTTLDLVELGYGERLAPLAEALQVGEISPEVTFEFTLVLTPPLPSPSSPSP